MGTKLYFMIRMRDKNMSKNNNLGTPKVSKSDVEEALTQRPLCDDLGVRMRCFSAAVGHLPQRIVF